MKILLLQPPVFDFYYTPSRSEPLGLFYIKHNLQKMPGVEADIYDATLNGVKKEQKTPACFDYLKDIYVPDRSAFSLLSKYCRFGDSFNKIIGRIIDGNYDAVGISSMFSAYHPDVEALIARIKAETGAAVMLGGWAVNAEHERLSRESGADLLFTGGGEIDISDFPQREGEYFYRGRRIAKITAGTGCFRKCLFCSVHRHRTFKVRDISSVEKELEYLYSIGVEIADFEDDCLFSDKAWSQELLKVLKKFKDKGMGFTAMNGIPADSLEPFARQAIDSGFIEFNVSLVSGNADYAASLGRPDLKESIKNVAAAAEGRIETLAFIIAGLPGTTPQSVLEDLLFLRGLPVKVGFSPLYMLPDTPMFAEMGLPEDRRLLRGSALYKFGEGFKRSDVASLWKVARIINFVKEKGQMPDNEYSDNLHYFKKSAEEKRWYIKTPAGIWEKGFSFDLDISAIADTNIFRR